MNRLIKWFKAWKLVSLRSAVVAAFLLYTIVGFLVVPAVAKKLIVDIVFDTTGREVTVEEVRCNPFALTFTVRGFSMPDRPDSTMVSFEEFYANAQLSSIFRWAATLKELRVTSPYVALRRFEDGTYNILTLLEDIEERAPEEKEPSEGLPRALLHKILVQNIRIDYQDLAQAKPILDSMGPGTLELHNISTLPDQTGTNELIMGLARGGTLRVTGELVVEPLSLNGTAAMEGLSLSHTWETVQDRFEFDLVSGTAAGQLSYSVGLEDDGLHASVEGFNGSLKDLAVKLRDSDIRFLEVPSVDISGASFSWPEAEVEVSGLEVQGADAHAWLEPDGTPSWAALVPQETREKVKEVAVDVAKSADWVVAVDRFDLSGCSAHFEDRTFDDPVKLWVEDADLTLTDVITEPEKQWGLSGSVRLFGETETAAEGFFQMKPLLLEADVNLAGLDITRAQPYVGQAIPVRLLSGALSTTSRAVLSPDGDGPMATLTGDLEIEGFGLQETATGTRLLGWDLLKVNGVSAALGPLSATVDSVDLNGAQIDAVLAEDGRINALAMLEEMSSDSAGGQQATAGSSAPEGPAELPPVEIGAVNLRGFVAAYTDKTFNPPFALALQSVDGQVSGISTAPGARTAIDIGGEVRSGGTVNVKGEVELLDPKSYIDLAVDVRHTNLPPVSPVSVSIISHPIDEGRADVELDYQVVDSNLEGNNVLVTRGLTLGDKVESEDALDLPVKLGVSLLTDSTGQIRFEVPVSGSLEDPSFSLGSLVGQASKQALTGIVKSPFKLLGKLGGGSGEEDLGFVEFEAGSSRLDGTATERLDQLARGLTQRPSLVLLVEGVWDTESDPAPLRREKYENLVADRTAAAAGVELEPVNTLELLESIYRESHSEEELAALRAPHFAGVEDVAEGLADAVLDEEGFQRDLEAAVLAAQPVTEDDLRSLGEARAEAVHAYITGTTGVNPQQVKATAPVAAAGSGERMRCRLDVRSGS